MIPGRGPIDRFFEWLDQVHPEPVFPIPGKEGVGTLVILPILLSIVVVLICLLIWCAELLGGR